jgi:DNA helicase IV
LRKGNSITTHDAKNLVQFFGSKIELMTGKDKYSITDLGFPVSARDIDWMSMLKGIAPDEREYLRSCLRNGESFSGKPKITISTIHQSKGGEADSVVLLTDMGRLSWENTHKDEENRVWYVALTRAKENLFLVRPRGLRYYAI